MLRASADFVFGPRKLKIFPLSPDKSTPLPLDGGARSTITVYGGAGPFDCSGAAVPAASPMSIKLDNGTAETWPLDLTVPVSLSAVTAAEMATAIEAANAAAGFVGVTATVDSRGYLQIDVDTPGTQLYLQVYGEAAELAEFGQGYGMQSHIIDTQQSVSVVPTNKDSETITITDSNGKDTEILTDGYRKGFTGVITDTARDKAVRAIIEGGVIDVTNKTLHAPNSDTVKTYFCMEVVRAFYSKGTNFEEALEGYILERFLICNGTMGDDPGDRNWLAYVYNIIGTEYKDPVSSVKHSDSFSQDFTPAEWDLLDWDNI